MTLISVVDPARSRLVEEARRRIAEASERVKQKEAALEPIDRAVREVADRRAGLARELPPNAKAFEEERNTLSQCESLFLHKRNVGRRLAVSGAMVGAWGTLGLLNHESLAVGVPLMAAGALLGALGVREAVRNRRHQDQARARLDDLLRRAGAATDCTEEIERLAHVRAQASDALQAADVQLQRERDSLEVLAMAKPKDPQSISVAGDAVTIGRIRLPRQS